MIQFSQKDIKGFDQRYRIQFINSIIGFKPAIVVGTIDTNQKTNLSIKSTVFHLGSEPPLIGMIVRPHTVPRHTLENIIATQDYTLNHIHQNFYINAHQTSARYPKETSEFSACNLTEFYTDQIQSPYVKEAHIKIGLKLKEIIPITINKTELVIGEIIEVILPKNCLKNDGFIDIESANTLAISGLDSYHQTKRIDQLTYAKPDKWPESKN